MPSQLISNSDLIASHGERFSKPFAQLQSWFGSTGSTIHALRRYRLFFWLVVFPMFLVSIYLWGYASDRYVSESRIAIKQADGAQSGSAGLGLIGLGGLRSMEDMHFLEQHIHSLDMLLSLERKLSLRDRWMASPDRFGRLEADASLESFLQYYRSRVHVSADASTGIITVETEAFDPDDARIINQGILSISDEFINELSNRVAREQVAFIEQELIESQRRVEATRASVLAYQNQHQVLDPTKQAEMKARLAADLETRLSELQAELNSSLSYLQPKAPPVLALRARIAAIGKQIAKEKAAISGDGLLKLNQIAADYQALTLSADFAADLYKTALSALERARVDATMKLKSLALIVSPHRPDEALRPRRIYLTLTWLLGLLALFGLVSLTKATIDDHRE
ncbi:MAG: capsular biosynthesis protein [Burkholderiaceae bacterium]